MQRTLLMSGAGLLALVFTSGLVFGNTRSTSKTTDNSQAVSAAAAVDDPEVDGDYGMLIVDLVEGGPAMQAGLDIDDTILSINGVRVQSVDDVKKALKSLKSVKGSIVIVFISDDTGDIEECDVTPKDGKLGMTLEVVELEDVD